MGPLALVRESIDAEKTYLQQADLHLETGDRISTESRMDDGWQDVRVRARVCVCMCLCLCVFGFLLGWGWLSREIIPLLGNTGGVVGRFFF